MIDQFQNARVLCCVAHPDDESVFACGAIKQLVRQNCSVWVQCVTAIADCNPISDDPAAESLRQQKRARAFVDACRLLGAWPLPNLEIANARHENTDGIFQMWDRLYHVFAAGKYQLCITHGSEGESGHKQHKIVSGIAMGTAKAFSIPCLTFSATGPIVVPVDVEAKQQVLSCYRFGTTRTPEWRPNEADNPELLPWLGNIERFDYFPGN